MSGNSKIMLGAYVVIATQFLALLLFWRLLTPARLRQNPIMQWQSQNETDRHHQTIAQSLPSHENESRICPTKYCKWYEDRKLRPFYKSSALFDTLTSTSILPEDLNNYFYKIGNSTCLSAGTENTLISTIHVQRKCMCKQGWYGTQCSLPLALKYSSLLKDMHMYNITTRTVPRKIVYATSFNIEFELLEARFHELHDLVDIFIIVESNYTGYGLPKIRRLLNSFAEGFCKWIHVKVVYVALDIFPEAAVKDGWFADDIQREIISQRHVLDKLQPLKSDDLFLITDADEIPKKDILLFLKVHDGYPEPFGFHLKKTTYGFFWMAGNGDWPIMAGSTLGMLRNVFGSRISCLRNPAAHLPNLVSNITAYVGQGGRVHPWFLGSKIYPVGWHCSWCFPPAGIRIKLQSAIKADFPRWGDYPEKHEYTYIENLIRKGVWFDDKTRMVGTNPTSADYAPAYLLKHKTDFEHLLQNMYT